MAPDEVARFREAVSAVTPHVGLSWADASVDSLGMDVIVYFPRWRLADEPAPAGAAPTDVKPTDVKPTDVGAPHTETGRSIAGCEEEWAVWSDEATADPNDEAALLRVRTDRADAMKWAATYRRRRRVARRFITRSRWIPVAPDREALHREAPEPGSAIRPPDSRSAPVVSHHAAPRAPDDRAGAGTYGGARPDRRVAREVIAAVCAAAEITPTRQAANDPDPGEPWLGVVLCWDALPRFLETLGWVRPWMIADARLRMDGEDVLVCFPGWAWAEPVSGKFEGGGECDR